MTDKSSAFLANLLAETRSGITRKRPTTTATMLAALDLGEQLFLEGRERDAILIAAALQALQSENIELTSALELAVMGADHERQRLETKMDQEKQAHKASGHAMLPWDTFVDLRDLADKWNKKKEQQTLFNREISKRPRPNRGFPGWMRDEAVAYAKTTKTPLVDEALKWIERAAEEHGYEGELPDPRTIRRWWKAAHIGKSSGASHR